MSEANEGAAGIRSAFSISGVSWGIGSIGPAVIYGVYSSLFFYYLVYQIGFTPAVATGLIFAARMADVGLAPLTGIISDRINSSWGRRRPFLLAAAILGPIAWLILFNVMLKGIGAAAWALMGLLLITACYSMYNIPWSAMANEMTSEPRERVRLMTFRMVFGNLGSLLAGTMPPLTKMFPGQKGYFLISLALSLAVGIPMLISFLGTRNTPTPPPRPGLKLSAMMQGVTQNRPLMILAGARVFSLSLSAGQIPAMLFFIQSVMKLPIGAFTVFWTAMNIVSLASAPFWAGLIRRFSMAVVRDTILMVGLVFCLSFFLARPHEPMIGMAIRGVLYGLVTGGFNVVAHTMQAEVIDYDNKLTGMRREGLFYAFFSFCEKTSGAVGITVIGILLTAFHFNQHLSPQADQPHRVVIGLYLVMALLPAMGYLVSLTAYRWYKLDPSRGIYPDAVAPVITEPSANQ